MIMGFIIITFDFWDSDIWYFDPDRLPVLERKDPGLGRHPVETP